MLKRRKTKRRQINAAPRGRKALALLSAASGRFRDVGGVFQEHVLWRIADRLKVAADVVRWPFERVAWALERRLLWPLQQRVAGRHPSARVGGAVALATIVGVAAAIGVLSVSGGGSDGEAGAPVAVRNAAAPVQPEPEESGGPALEGVAPSFGTGGVAPAPRADGGEATIADAPEASTAPTDASGEEEEAATSSSAKPVPAGPAAMKVARRFSEAFVLYEIGEKPARATAVFAETATPRLATALAERPPRLPEATEVPKARVLNLVPGPRHGKAYTVSASLLRVGVTSELRLEMKRQTGAWVVTDVRG